MPTCRGVRKKLIAMNRVRVFAPATVANMGCGFDIMGMTLDGVGDVLSVEADLCNLGREI